MVLGIALFLALLFGRAQPEKRPPAPSLAPLADVIIAYPVSHKLLVHTQGNIQPHREINLVAQVTGKILTAAPTFSDGSFFNQEQLLVSIEQDDYLVC